MHAVQDREDTLWAAHVGARGGVRVHVCVCVCVCVRSHVLCCTFSGCIYTQTHL